MVLLVLAAKASLMLSFDCKMDDKIDIIDDKIDWYNPIVITVRFIQYHNL